MAPEVSVCIPAYRGAEMLPASLRSVLAQDHDDFEVVVVDNASDDGTDRAVLPFLADPASGSSRSPTTSPCRRTGGGPSMPPEGSS